MNTNGGASRCSSRCAAVKVKSGGPPLSLPDFRSFLVLRCGRQLSRRRLVCNECASSLAHRLEALFNCHQWRRSDLLYGSAGAESQRDCRCRNVVRRFDYCDDIAIAEGKVRVFETRADAIEDRLQELDAIRRAFELGGPCFRSV